MHSSAQLYKGIVNERIKLYDGLASNVPHAKEQEALTSIPPGRAGMLSLAGLEGHQEDELAITPLVDQSECIAIRARHSIHDVRT